MTARSHTLRAGALCGASLAALAATVAHAQTTPPAPSGDVAVEEVVVTAQKRAEPLAKVPLSVQAIGQRELQNAGVVNTTDLVNLIPSASVVSSTSPGFDTIQIRGIASGTTGDGLVGYYVDELPFGIPNLQLSPPGRLLDIQRSEVIRGPSGTLYGQGSMGGTIKLVTNKPDLQRYSGAVAAEYSGTEGGDDNYEGEFVANVPLVKDKLAVRVSGSYDKLGGYAEVPEFNLKNANGVEQKNVRVAVRWQATPSLTVDGLYWHIDNAQDFSNNLTPQNAPASLTAALTPVYAAYGALAPVYAAASTAIAYPVQPVGETTISGNDGVRGFIDTKADVYSVTLNLETSVGTITSNTSYINHKLDFVAPVLGYLVNDSTFKTHSLTQELRIASNPDSPIRYLGGIFFRDATINSDINFYEDLKPFFVTGTVPLIDIVGPLHTQSYSLFGEVSKGFLGDRLEALAGLRYFHDDRSSDGLDRATGLRSSTGAVFDSFNPRFNLKYNINVNSIVFFNAAKGFRSGTLQTPAQVSQAAAQGIPTSTEIRPDSLWTYELGTRWQLFNRRLVLEGSIYRTDWSDIQIQFTNSASSVSVVNGGDARIEGFDVAARWRTPIEGLSLQVQGSGLDPTLVNVNRQLLTSPTIAGIKEGGRIPNVPTATYTLAGDYERPLPWLGGLKGSLYAGYSYRSDQIDAASGLKSGNVNDLTLRGALEKDGLRLEVFAQNALDDRDPAVLQAFTYQIIYPRRVGVRVAYSF